MSGIVALGQTSFLQATSVAANVSYPPSVTQTFRIVNTSASATAYVGVYNDATVAANIAKPTAGSTYPGVVGIAPGWFEVISGNFGAQNQNTIYVAGVSNGTVDLYITPVRD